MAGEIQVLLGVIATAFGGLTVIISWRVKIEVHDQMSQLRESMNRKLDEAQKTRIELVQRIEHMERGYAQHHAQLEKLVEDLNDLRRRQYSCINYNRGVG